MRKVLIIAGVLASACGVAKAPGAGDSGVPVDAGVDAGPVASACAASTQTRCTQLEMCEPGALTAGFGDVSTCEQRLLLSCTNSQNAPSTGQNPTNLQACSLALSNESCTMELAGTTPPSCEPPIGQVANGGACAFDGQCQSQFCNAPLSSICGTCAPQPTEGAPCSRTGCGLDLQCETIGATSMCETPVTSGTCDVTHPCATGSSCVGTGAGSDGGARTGTCTPFATSVGAGCSGSGHTAAQCDHRLGLFCMLTSGDKGTCVEATYVAAGAPCGQLDGGVAICEASGNCQKATGQAQGICEAPIADGMSCDTASGAACIPPAICAAGDAGTLGTCTVPNASQCM